MRNFCAFLLLICGFWTQGQNYLRSSGGVNNDEALDIAQDAAGNAVVTGFFKGSATFGSVTLNSVGGSQDVFVAKYDTNGNVLWAV